MGKLVVHKNNPHDVYIGRPSIWGNPFSHLQSQSLAKFKVASRDEAVSSYRNWILNQRKLIVKAQEELRGKILGCWCAPLSCHGDVLAEIANAVCEGCGSKRCPNPVGNPGDSTWICDDCLTSCSG